MTVSKSGSLVSYSNRVVWLGNKTTGSFRLHGVSISDDGFYGCKLDFEAFTVRDSVRLTVIGKNANFFFPTKPRVSLSAFSHIVGHGRGLAMGISLSGGI